MARTIRDYPLATRAQRGRLAPRKRPYPATLILGELALLYTRPPGRDRSGPWSVRQYLGEGRYQTTALGPSDDLGEGTGLTHAEAVAKAMALAGKPKARRGGVTVADVCEAYATWLRSDRPASATDFEDRAAFHILPTLGSIPASKWTTQLWEGWRNKMAAAPAYGNRAATTDDARRARRASAHRIWSRLRAALNRAHKMEMVSDNSSWTGVDPLKDTYAARKRILSVEEARRLIRAADVESGFRDLVLAALATGSRYSELCRLEVQDFRHGKVHIVRSKAGHDRWVVLTEEGISLFERLSAGRPGGAPMLPRYGTEIWKTSNQQKFMLRAVRAAQISPAITFHGLRHTYASLSVMGGMPLMVLARNLGHVDLAMVIKHYGHLESSFVDAEIIKAAPRFGFNGPTNVRTLRNLAG